MDQRTGNPINLCLIYILLARRLRLPVAGIGLPGHFICRYQSTAAEIYLDPFNRGKFLTKADCIQFLINANCSLRNDYLVPVSPRRLLLRICSNLHQVYQRLEQAVEAMRLQRYLGRPGAVRGVCARLVRQRPPLPPGEVWVNAHQQPVGPALLEASPDRPRLAPLFCRDRPAMLEALMRTWPAPRRPGLSGRTGPSARS